MGGSGENQAIRMSALSVRGRFAVRQAGLELVQRGAQPLGLLAKLTQLAAVAGLEALDLPVQLLEQQIGPVEEVLHELLGDVRAASQHCVLELLDVPLHLAVVDLERKGPKIPAECPTAAVGVDGALRKELLPDNDQQSLHDYSLTHASRITAAAPEGVVRLSPKAAH